MSENLHKERAVTTLSPSSESCGEPAEAHCWPARPSVWAREYALYILCWEDV